MTPRPSDRILAGQRLMVGFDGTHLDEDLKYLIRDIGVTGIILFKKNIQTPEQIRELTRSVQEYAASCGKDPLFIAVDQEGGEVARLRGLFFTEFPGNPHIQNSADAHRFAEVTASELRSIGINMNMAPVLDVVPAGINSVMAGRSFAGDPFRVSELGQVVISLFQGKGVLSVAKHFPGMGRAVIDPHVDPIDLRISLPEMEACDLVPFKDAVEAGVSGIMLSHLVYSGIDPDWPASLSEVIAKDLLQHRMGFTGIVFTDDLDMGAIESHYPVETLAERILEARIDIALVCHRTEKIEAFFESVLKTIGKSSRIRQSGVAACRKITEVKRTFLNAPISQ